MTPAGRGDRPSGSSIRGAEAIAFDVKSLRAHQSSETLGNHGPYRGLGIQTYSCVAAASSKAGSRFRAGRVPVPERTKLILSGAILLPSLERGWRRATSYRRLF